MMGDPRATIHEAPCRTMTPALKERTPMQIPFPVRLRHPRPPTQPPPPAKMPQRHEEYYFDDGSVILLVSLCTSDPQLAHRYAAIVAHGLNVRPGTHCSVSTDTTLRGNPRSLQTCFPCPPAGPVHPQGRWKERAIPRRSRFRA